MSNLLSLSMDGPLLFFCPSRGVPQGCQLSPLLYVISIEVLAVCIRTSPRMTGVALPNSVEEFRCSGYANDTTVAATTDASIEETFSLYDLYERASGACLNRGKSKGIWAGSWKDRADTPHGIQWLKDLPLLGMTFNVGDYTIARWKPAVFKLESRLAAWSGRKLSFRGKSVIINTLALSQLWHLCHVFPVPKWAEKRINTAVCTFFWSGKRDLVARTTVWLPPSQGGFGVVNFNLKAQAFALQWLKRYFTPDRGKWKSFFTFFISPSFCMMPREALLSRHRLRDLPPFYHILFQVWRTLDGGLANDGVLSVLALTDAPLPVDLISSQNIYALLRSRASPEKFLPTYGPLHWPQTWSQLHLCHLDRTVIDLNWQIAHGVLYTGARLAHRFHMHIDPRCSCAADDETLEHLFFECELARILVAWVYFHYFPPPGEELVFSF